MDNNQLRIFVHVARRLNFRRASKDLELSPSAVSHAINQLENELDIRLFQRTTRSASLTEAGEIFRSQIEPAFETIDTAIATVSNLKQEPVGLLKISVERSLGLILTPRLISFLKSHPKIKTSIFSCNSSRDIVQEGFDAGICYKKQVDPNMIAAPIGVGLEFCVVGSPEYFQTRAKPETPDNLISHDCIEYNEGSINDYSWRFYKDGHQVVSAVQGTLRMDDQDLMIEAAIAGYGLAYVSRLRAESAIEQRLLETCLENWCPIARDVFLCYPSRKHKSAALNAFVNAMRLEKTDASGK